jgi:hypothetical protein
MPTYFISCYTTGTPLEFILDAPTAPLCVDLAFDYFSLMATPEHGELDEIVVRPPEGEHTIDGDEDVYEIYWTTPGFHQRLEAELAANPELRRQLDALHVSAEALRAEIKRARKKL